MISARNTRADSEEPQVKLCSVEKTLCSVVFDMTLVGTNDKTCVLSNAGISQNYSEIRSLTWVFSNERATKLPFWSQVPLGEGLEEDEKTDIPEGGEAAVVDGVEDGDLEPGERGSGEECSIVRVVEEISKGLPACPVPAWWLDSHGSQHVFLCLLLAHLDLLSA